MDFWLKDGIAPVSHALSLSRASLSLSSGSLRHRSRPRFGRPFSHPATTRVGIGPKMTGLTPPSYPTCSPTSAGSDTAGKCRKTAGFYPDFPELVPAIPATKSCDQGMRRQLNLRIGFRPDFGMRFRPLPEAWPAVWSFPAAGNYSRHPRAAGACGGAWARKMDRLESPERISHIAYFPGSLGLDRWMVLPGSCRIRRIVKRSPGYSRNANPGVRVLVTVRSCDRERSDRPIWTKLAGRAS
ncbi:unnamed protein product [Prunus armeniaca]